MIKINRIDHFVLTVHSIQKSCDFYSHILGMKVINFQNNERTALQFGNEKINLHQIHHEFNPKAHYPTPGAYDFCLITDNDINDVVKFLQKNNVQIIEGPIMKHGAMGNIKSVYIRDPDQNLVEISNYIK